MMTEYCWEPLTTSPNDEVSGRGLKGGRSTVGKTMYFLSAVTEVGATVDIAEAAAVEAEAAAAATGATPALVLLQ